tara:strand:- start:533 stop:862 length:330 start_codon:yes stop_codon:yes gene_type:complete
MFQAGASSEQVEGDVEHMVGFGIRHVKHKDRTATIDALHNAQLPNQPLRDANSPTRNDLSLFRQFIFHVRTRQHRRLPVPVGFIGPFLRATLPCIESSLYIFLHLKTSP